uniref:Uncharacterized protein n=1 Tax=Arundo donax TaxID=35708 RepID=A0A0A9GP71_ARUDO
MQQVPHVSKCK